MPLIEEVAADIFMGEFGPKFLLAAQFAANELKGTLCQVYFQAEFAEIKRMTVPEKDTSQQPWSWFGFKSQGKDAFSELCARRASFGKDCQWSVAANGMEIEQQQILTTQNLSVLVKGLNLRMDRVAAATLCWRWIIQRFQQRPARHHAKIILVKNAVYAWRQMVYFLSGLATVNQREFAFQMRQMVPARASIQVRECLQPLIRGLERAIDGLPPDAPPVARSITGWSVERHWLVELMENQPNSMA